MDHGAVVSIKSKEEWDAALKKAEAEGKAVGDRGLFTWKAKQSRSDAGAFTPVVAGPGSNEALTRWASAGVQRVSLAFWRAPPSVGGGGHE